MSEPLIVVPTYIARPEDLEVVEVCLRSLVATAPNADVIVVDDCSPAEALVDELASSIAGLESQGAVRLSRKDENTGFSKTVNVGLAAALANGQDAVLANADMKFVEKDWLPRLLEQPRSDGAGAAEVVGGLLLYPSGLIQHAGIFFSLLHRAFDHRFRYAPGNLPEAQQAVRCPVTGALQLIRHSTLETVGLYDEDFLLGWEDVDYCIRVFQAGGECVYQPSVRALHYESLFRGRPSKKLQDWQARSWVYFMSKYSRTSFAEWVPTL